MTKMYVVVVGKAFGNKTIHGPFYSIEDAQYWAENDAYDQSYSVVRLHDPNA